MTASLPYLPPTFQYAEDRLGKHDVAVSPKLFGLIKIPAGALIFRFATFEDISGSLCKAMRSLFRKRRKYKSKRTGQTLLMPRQYRTGEFSYVRDPYAGFLESPAEELMAPVRGWLRGSGDFNAVVEAGSALTPDTLVEISVSHLFGDFRQPKRAAAILTMRFVFFDATNGVPGNVIFQQEYSRSIPLSTPAAATLMDGWEQALSEIMAEVSSDFRHSDASASAGRDK